MNVKYLFDSTKLGSITNSMDMNLSELWELVMDGQGGLACCDSWGRKESDMTEQLNGTELILLCNRHHNPNREQLHQFKIVILSFSLFFLYLGKKKCLSSELSQ